MTFVKEEEVRAYEEEYFTRLATKKDKNKKKSDRDNLTTRISVDDIGNFGELAALEGGRVRGWHNGSFVSCSSLWTCV